MRALLICIICLCISATLWAQNFEGKIVYQLNYKSKTSKFTDKQLATMLGTKQEYYVKGGDYKTINPSVLGEWHLYINQENKYYSKKPDSDLLSWNDGASYNDPVLNSNVTKNAIKVKGYNCDELVLTCKSGVQKYYFSDSLKVDYKLYQKHKYGNYDAYTAQAKALPLKLIIETEYFTLESVAVEIVPQVLSSDIFTLPAGLKVARKPNR